MCILPGNIYLSQNRFQPLFMRKVITTCLLDPEKGVEEASHPPWNSGAGRRLERQEERRQ